MKSISTMFMAAAVLAGASVASAQLTLPVSESFPTGAPQLSWVAPDGLGGTVAYSTIIASATTAPGGDGFALDGHDGSGHQAIWLSADTGNLGDYRVTAYIYVPSTNGTDWSRVGIFARAESEVPSGTFSPYKPDGYYFVLDSDGTTFTRVGKIIDNSGFLNANMMYRTGAVNSPVGDTTAYNVDGWNKLVLELVGDQISAFLNDVELPNSPYTDAVYSTGRVGIYNFRATASAVSTIVDRISIEALSTSVDHWNMY